MYSPKISEDLIPSLYQLAKAEGIAMTKYVDRILRPRIKDLEKKHVGKELV